MATVGTSLLTAEQFQDWVSQQEGLGHVWELERGRIVEMSRPGKRHGLICANVVRILGNYTAERQWGYVCSNDTGLIVERNPDTMRGPDVLLFDNPEQVEAIEEKYGETPPLLAVEVLSPNDTHGKVVRRVKEQIRFGTQRVWVLDPDARNVVVYYPAGTDQNVEEHEALSGDPVLPDFSCPVSVFFSLPGRAGQMGSASTP